MRKKDACDGKATVRKALREAIVKEAQEEHSGDSVKSIRCVKNKDYLEKKSAGGVVG